MKKICITFCLFLISLCIHAQIINGIIVDEKKQPLEFANVVLLSLPDSTFLQGTISDQTGAFSIKSNEIKGILRISTVGYSTIFLPCTSSNIGTIQLCSDTQLLGEVIIKGNLPTTRIKGDAMVTNVAGTLLERSGTAENLLDKIPGVSSSEGNVTVFGRGAPEIYINGRKVRNDSELDQLSADNIKTVEVINNPGARYAASVKAVIRISTKKALGDGFGFNNRTFMSYNKKWTFLNQFDFNYRNGGFDLLGMIYAHDRYGWEDKTSVQHTYLDKYWIQNSNIYNKMHSQNISGMLALNYTFNENHSMGIRYDYDRIPKSSLILDMPTTVYQDNIVYENSNSHGQNLKQQTNHQVNMYYNSKVSEWNIDFNADGLWSNAHTDSYTNEETHYSTMEHDKRIVTTFNKIRNTLYAAKLILSHPLLGGTFTLGSEYSHTQRTSEYLSPEGFTDEDESKIKEGGLAIFADYSHSFGKVDIQAGLRFENVIFDYYQYGKHIDEQSKKYNNLFPSLSISFPINKVQVKLNYAADISRPYYGQLRSNVMYINRYTYEGGNPFLLPSLSHNLTLGTTYKWVYLSAGYQYIKDAIVFFSGAYSEDDSTIALINMVNAPDYDKIFASLVLSPTIGIWSPQFSAQIEKQWYTIDTPNGKKDLNAPLATLSWKNNFKLPAGFLLDISASFYTKGYTENQQRLDNIWRTDMVISKTFLNNQLSFQLRANDIFNTMGNNMLLYSGPIRSLALDNKPNMRNISLTVRYKFNSTKNKYKGTGAGDEQKSRM